MRNSKSITNFRLSLKYNLPLIDVRGVIDVVKAQSNEFAEQIKNYLNEKREQAIQTKQTEYEQLKEKQKKLPKEYRKCKN